jgi:Cu/Ag efflux pump CusA
MSKLTEVDQFNDIVITTRNGFPIKIKDIGTVEKTGGEPSSTSSLDGVTSVSVGIRKQAGSEYDRGYQQRKGTDGGDYPATAQRHEGRGDPRSV